MVEGNAIIDKRKEQNTKKNLKSGVYNKNVPFKNLPSNNGEFLSTQKDESILGKFEW